MVNSGLAARKKELWRGAIQRPHGRGERPTGTLAAAGSMVKRESPNVIQLRRTLQRPCNAADLLCRGALPQR
jgi:hypothetical protein